MPKKALKKKVSEQMAMSLEDTDILNKHEVGEESEDDLAVDYLNRITEAVTWSTDWTVESLINQLERLVINLSPKFQRRDAWNDKKKSRLIESLIYGLPIPQIVLAESASEKGRYIIVDGKQRLLTLKQFCQPKEVETPFKTLTNLKNPILNNVTFASLEENHKKLFDNFITQSIRSVIIKNWPSETFLYTIFYRLNTGSLSLSPQELRRALKPGPFMDFVDDFATSSKVIQKALNLSAPDYRMRDLDLIIRFYSFGYRISQYKGDFKTFLDSTCDFFNSDWVRHESIIRERAVLLEKSITTVNQVFKGNSFKRWEGDKYSSGFNKTIFDIMVFYLQNQDVRDQFVARGSQVISEFKNLCEKNPRFLKSISTNTNNLIQTSARFVLWGMSLRKIIKKIEIPATLQKVFKANS